MRKNKINELKTLFEIFVILIKNLVKVILKQSSDTFFSSLFTRLFFNSSAYRMSFWESHFEASSLQKYPEISGSILDFGCGTGNLDIIYGRLGYTIHGIDNSPLCIALANFFLKKEVNIMNISFEECNIISDKPQDGFFDAGWSTQVFEHIKDPTEIFLGLRNWIKVGGYFLICVPLGYAYDDPDHANHFMNTEDLNKYLQGHIEVIKIDEDISNKVIRALCKF